MRKHIHFIYLKARGANEISFLLSLFWLKVERRGGIMV